MHPWLLLLCLLAASLHAEDDATPPLEGSQPDPPLAGPLVPPDNADAIRALEGFIREHPDSEQVSAARFRLAAHLVTQADANGEASGYAAAAAQLELLVGEVETGRSGDFEQLSEALYLLGWCLREIGPDRAAEAWRRVVQLSPATPLAASSLLQLGQQAMDQADWEQAADHFEAARATPTDAATRVQATYLAGWAHTKAEAWDPAIEAFVAVLNEQDAATLQAEALDYLVLVLVERCDALGLDLLAELGDRLAQVPTALQPRFLERTAEVLEGLARFDQADAVRATSAGPARTPRRTRPKHKD